MGSVGYLRFDDRVYFQVGSGMVHDSEPEAEYRKTLHKARALFQALNLSPHVEAST